MTPTPEPNAYRAIAERICDRGHVCKELTFAQDQAEIAAILREELTPLLEAAALKRSTIIGPDEPGKSFRGQWIAVPAEDFDALRTALLPYKESHES